jgi:hypothetical protein
MHFGITFNFKDADLVELSTKKEEATTVASTKSTSDSGKAALETSGVDADEHAGIHQERAVTRDVVIPSSVASSFIGKNGANVRKLQSDTKTRISSKSCKHILY